MNAADSSAKILNCHFVPRTAHCLKTRDVSVSCFYGAKAYMVIAVNFLKTSQTRTETRTELQISRQTIYAS